METVCSCCRAPKASFVCGLCQGVVCKKCVETLKENHFSFLDKTPPELSHRTYCAACFTNTVAPAMETYDRDMARARAVIVFHKNQGEETRLYKRIEKPIKVEDCRDREETLLRLAFAAAKAKFNALVDVDIVHKKIRNFGYQKMMFSGTGTPIQIDPIELARREKARF